MENDLTIKRKIQKAEILNWVIIEYFKKSSKIKLIGKTNLKLFFT